MEFYNFKYVLVGNESEEMAEEWGTENFKFPYADSATEQASSIEGFIDSLKAKFKKFSNEDWYWEGNEEGTDADFWFGNDRDGLVLRFEITREGKSK